MALALQESLISRNHSTTLKGVLMLLIILGHNAILMEHNGDFTYKEFLYTFHVWGFFLLPFLYPISKPSFAQLRKYAKRLILPYCILFLFFLLVFSLLTKTIPNLKETSLAFISASQLLLKQTIGFRLLWFLPTMFIILIARDAYYYATKPIQIAVITICIVSTLYSFIDENTYWKIMYNMPLGLIYLPRLLLLGILARRIIYLINNHNYDFYFFLTTSLLAIITTLSFFTFVDSIPLPALLNRQILLPIVFFFFLYYLLKNISISICTKIGLFSFSIYIIHQPVYNLLFHFLQTHTLHWFFLGILVFFLTTIISYLLAWFWNMAANKLL